MPPWKSVTEALNITTGIWVKPPRESFTGDSKNLYIYMITKVWDHISLKNLKKKQLTNIYIADRKNTLNFVTERKQKSTRKTRKKYIPIQLMMKTSFSVVLWSLALTSFEFSVALTPALVNGSNTNATKVKSETVFVILQTSPDKDSI